MTTASEIANSYIATWNETDPHRRRALLVEHWTDNATYIDPVASAAGRAQIGELIESVQQRFPGFRFVLGNRVDHYGNKIRFSWSFGPEGQMDLIQGTDFCELEGERLDSVTGFLDKLPPGN
jgi:hypothetical protein